MEAAAPPPPDLLDALVEAMLFEAAGPLAADALARRAAKATGHAVDAEDVRASVERLRARLAGRASALDVAAWAGGLRLVTRAEVAPLLMASHDVEASPRRLTASLLETLAVVAYRQPVTRAEVEHVRGVDADYALRRLEEFDLVAETGRADTVGRPALFGTTAAFLDAFGLASLADLPDLASAEALLADPAFSAERARLLAPARPFDASPTTPPAPDPDA